MSAQQHQLTIDLIKQATAALESRHYERAHAACIEVLKRDPQQPQAFYLLGILTADHDNHAKACELYDRALAISDEGRFNAQKARSLIALNRRAEAIDAAEHAGRQSSLDAHTLDTIGVVFSRAGLHSRAVAFYQRATEQAPENPSYWYNLATALQFSGQLEDAETALRRTLALDARHVKSWAALSQLGSIPSDQSELDELVALFETLDEPEHKLQIGHAIAKAHEDAGDATRSMQWLAKAKAAKRAELKPTSVNDAALFDAATKTTSLTSEGHEDPSPIFIVGLPRTGTTLVDRILSSHPDIVSAGELTDFALALKRATGTPSRFVLDPETLDAAANVNLGAVGGTYIKSARRVAGNAPRFIDKMPLNFFYAAAIHQALPNARIICLRRHPADSVLSNYRQLFATGFSYYDYALDLEQTAEYYAGFDGLMAAFRNALPPDRFTETRYEGVVADLEGEARRLIAFCGLEWDPACINFHQNKSPVATASSVQVRQPLYSSSVDRWKRYESDMEPALNILRTKGFLSGAD